jgi:ABC-2 type transport system permease protein
MERNMMGQPRLNPEMSLLEQATNDRYVLAAQIKGKQKPSENMPMSDKPAETTAGEPAAPEGDKDPTGAAPPTEKKDDAKAADPKADAKVPEKPVVDPDPEINVIVVGDIDCLYTAFFAVRARGEDPDDEFDFHFDNVPFVLNVLDTLAEDERFVEIRTRRPAHRTLKRVNDATEKAREDADQARLKYGKEYKETLAREQKEFNDQIDQLQKRQGGSSQQAAVEFFQAKQAGEARLTRKTDQLKRKRDDEIKKAETKLAQEVGQVQDGYKLWAVLLPPIPPLIVAFIVFFSRRASEREGVSKARLR